MMDNSVSEEVRQTIEPESMSAEFRSSSQLSASTTSLPTTDHHDPTLNLWDAAQWTQNIKQDPHVQQAQADLKQSLETFFPEAQNSDRILVQESQRKVLELMVSAKAEHDKRCPSKDPKAHMSPVELFKSGYQNVAETGYEYMQILDVMVGQAPEYVALIYGAVKIIFVVQINHQEMKEKVKNYMDTIKSRFEAVNHITSYMPTEKLVAEISKLYYYFQSFLAQAVKFYTRNRLKNYLKSMKKPWKQLEPFVISIDETYRNIKDILHLHGHFIGQVNLNLNQGNATMIESLVAKTSVHNTMLRKIYDMISEETSVKISKKKDVEEMAESLRQRLDERSETVTTNPSVGDQNDEDLRKNSSHGDSIDEIDQLLEGAFPELRKFAEASAQRQRVIETMPEMRSYRMREKNSKKIEKVMEWLESASSQLLWIDGNNVLSRFDLNAIFTGPLLISGDFDFKSPVVLRHFCGNVVNDVNGYKTLIQSLLFQLFKVRRKKLQAQIREVKSEEPRDIRGLWTLFTNCLRAVQSDCIFIVIDGIDFLRNESQTNVLQDEVYVLDQLNNLVNDKEYLAKILLTAKLAQHSTTDTEKSMALLTNQFAAVTDRWDAPASSSDRRGPSRRLFTDSVQNDMALVLHEYVEIQERITSTVTFTRLPMIYPPKTMIYTMIDNDLCAFIVSEIWGMESRGIELYSPLHIRAWSVDHNGRYLIKRYHEFLVPQFSGKREISTLKFVPAGHLPDEHEERERLASRGSRYWTFSKYDYIHQQYEDKNQVARVVIDQCTRPLQSELYDYQLDERISLKKDTAAKPSLLMICPPRIDGYLLSENRWVSLNVLALSDTEPRYPKYSDIVLLKPAKELLLTTIMPYSMENVKDHVLQEPTMILFRGGSGCGKTATVEAISDLLQKPLLPIDMIEIGGTSKTISHNFRDTFAMGSRWKAIIISRIPDLSLIQEDVVMKVFEQYRGLIFFTITENQQQNLSFEFRIRLHQLLEFPGPTPEISITIFKQLLEHAEIRDQRIIDYVQNYFAPDKRSRSAKHKPMYAREIQKVLFSARRLAISQGLRISTEHIMTALRLSRPND